MPCRDDYDDYSNYSEEVYKKELSVVAPALCAVFRALAKEKGLLMEGLLNQIDWREAGVTKKQVLDWWKNHEEQDRIRIEIKRKQDEQKKLKKVALAKLTPEERKVLGIK